jgi:integrase
VGGLAAGPVQRRVASNQYRALQQFFKWLAAEEEIPDPTAGMKPPRVPDEPVPVFTGDELPRLQRACSGRGLQDRRDAAIIAVLEATGIRLSELVQIRQRHLPGRRPAAAASAASTCSCTGSGTTSATRGWIAADPRAT